MNKQSSKRLADLNQEREKVERKWEFTKDVREVCEAILDTDTHLHCYPNVQQWMCVYCYARDETQAGVEHDRDCPVTVAKELLTSLEKEDIDDLR